MSLVKGFMTMASKTAAGKTARKATTSKETNMKSATIVPTYQFKEDAKSALKDPIMAQVGHAAEHVADYDKARAHKHDAFTDPFAKGGKGRDFSADDCTILAIETWLAKSDETRYATAAQLRDFGAKTLDGTPLESLFSTDKDAWRKWCDETPHVTLPMVFKDGLVHAWHDYYRLDLVQVDTDGAAMTDAAKARKPKAKAKAKARRSAKAATAAVDPELVAQIVAQVFAQMSAK